jgi:hypothetical protein
MTIVEDLDKDQAYKDFLFDTKIKLRATYGGHVRTHDFTMEEFAKRLGVDETEAMRLLNCQGDITLKNISDMYAAMGREASIYITNTTLKNGYYGTKYEQSKSA